MGILREGYTERLERQLSVLWQKITPCFLAERYFAERYFALTFGFLSMNRTMKQFF